MNRVNELVRAYFRHWPVIRIGSLVLVICLLILCAVGVWNAYSTPTEKEEQITRLTYSQSSDFGYSARVINNDLYGNTTLTEEDTSLLFLGIVDSIEGSFSYRLSSDQPVRDVSHRIGIEAVVASQNDWSKTVILVPETVETGPFSITFPIDTDQLFELIDAIEEQIGITSSAYNLTIQASVRTTGVTDYGPINELLTQSMSGALQPAKLAWDSEPPLSQTLYGSLQDTIVIPVEQRGNEGIAWPIACGLVLLLGSYVVWNYSQSRPLPLTAVEEEARRAKKKHEDVIVDVEKLPETKAEEMIVTVGSSEAVIPVSSLDDLVKVSESLLKPVLHMASPGKHVYWVIDGLATYEYVSEESALPDESEP